MENTSKIPHFSYIINSPKHKQYRCIVTKGEVIDKIDDLNEFYKTFGYTDELAQAGILADEFIWTEYVEDSNLDVCMQMHIAEYLNNHSPKFREQYGNEYEAHVKEHVAARKNRGFACFACRHKPFCKDVE